MKKKKNKPNAFTLIEVLIVLALFITIGTIIVVIISYTFKGNSKTRVSTNISQNGNYALSAITNVLYNAAKLESFKDMSLNTYTICKTDLLSSIDGNSVTVKGLDGGVSILACDNTAGTITSNSASLIDLTLVKVANCKITCSQADEYSPPKIDFTFDLVNAVGNSNELKGSSKFTTSVSLRNSNLK